MAIIKREKGIKNLHLLVFGHDWKESEEKYPDSGCCGTCGEFEEPKDRFILLAILVELKTTNGKLDMITMTL